MMLPDTRLILKAVAARTIMGTVILLTLPLALVFFVVRIAWLVSEDLRELLIQAIS